MHAHIIQDNRNKSKQIQHTHRNLSTASEPSDIAKSGRLNL